MHSNLLNELESITGIGEKKAKELISKGVKSIDDLKIPKFYDDLPIDAKIVIDYKPCPIHKNLAKILIDNYLPRDWIPVGSYRRGAELSYDLDFLSLSNLQYTHDMLNIIANIGKKIEVLKEFSYGEKRSSYVLKLLFPIPPTCVIAKIPPPIDDLANTQKYNIVKCNIIKIDIFRTTQDDLPYSLFHYTGNKIFNIRTRAHAKHLGYTLNQYGLFKNGKQLYKNDIKSENDLFNILGVTYKTPEERNE
jgi:DNA polymerase/3'-5' exonuclease PolX